MESKYRATALLFLLAAIACQQKEQETPQSFEPKALTFIASNEESNQTRTSIEFTDETHFDVLWSLNESINIFYGNTGESPGSRFVSENNEPSASAPFSGTINGFTGLDENGSAYWFWGVYPYSEDNRCDGNSVKATLPTIQTALAGNIADNTMLRIARASGLTLPFYNVWALFRIRLTNSDIKSITFRGNNGEILSGKVSVTMGTDGKPVWSSIPGEGKTYVTLKAPEGTTLQANQDYYIAFLPQNFSNGFTFSFHKSTGEFGSYKVTSNVTLERSNRYNLLDRDGGTYVTYSTIIDMGNGLKVANVNIGGASETAYGERFAWGETTNKSSYSWDNYFWGTSGALTKYTDADGKMVLDPEDDPATVICGEDWRTPTKEEWASLLNAEQYDIAYGDNSITVSNKTFPERHFTLYSVSSGNTDYWSSSRSADADFLGVCLRIIKNASCNTENLRPRCEGKYIRPIYVRVPVSDVSLDPSSLELEVGENATLTPIITPSTATKKNVRWESDSPNIATVDENGVVTAVARGETTITVTTIDGNCSAECDVKVYPKSGDFVEMGPDQLWGTCDMGATRPKDAGSFFSWGETSSKQSFGWSSYIFCYGSTANNISSYQYPDGNTDAIWYENGAFIGDGFGVLQLEDDAASVKWGRQWRIPTRSDWEWLRDNCVWMWDEEQNGYHVISRVSGYVGNQIFLSGKSGGRYWSSTLDGYNSQNAYIMKISATEYQTNTHQRFQAGRIRPVCSPMVRVSGITLNKTSLTMEINQTETLTATVSPSNASEKNVAWSSSDPSVATVSADGVVTVLSAGTTTITAMVEQRNSATCEVVSVGYPVTGVTISKTAVTMGVGQTRQLGVTVLPQNATNKAVTWTTSNSSVATVSSSGLVTSVGMGSATITVRTNDGGFTATCAVTVKTITGTLNGHEWVDMGNGLKWATMNIGATTVADNGSYFAWGETSTKDNYTSSTYLYSGNPSTLPSDHDAATAQWGSSWHMPTHSDWQWLLDNCSRSCVSVSDGNANYQFGIRFFSEITGNELFLPFASYMEGSSLKTPIVDGYYWSSSASTIVTNDAFYLSAKGTYVTQNISLYVLSFERYWGLPVRPVSGTSQ